ncbi:hypothetical protein LR48_Vigan03g000500 [Vigna angularis]|uniref:Uncharacterized protein n=1 Tax=Phaseolus angularis TaxID=3914 RepID=A0A0L9U2I3_PHAAN|nr:hypothetical protein LR48_Vigan03g000500 [Vigna angularis]
MNECRKGPAFGGILKKLAFGREHNQSDLSITEHRDFVGFLEKSRSPFGKGDLLACFVLDPFELNPTPSHLSSMVILRKHNRTRMWVPWIRELPEWGLLCSVCGTQPSLLIG